MTRISAIAEDLLSLLRMDIIVGLLDSFKESLLYR